MDPVTLGYGVACAAVFMIAAFSSRAWQDVTASVALIVMYALTKAFHYPSDSIEGIALDAVMPVIGALTACFIIQASPRLYWPRIMVCAMLLTSVEVFAFAWSLHYGFAYPKNTHRAIDNVLYAVALASVASPGVRNGIGVVRLWVLGHYHNRPWSSPGAQWGRDLGTTRTRRR